MIPLNGLGARTDCSSWSRGSSPFRSTETCARAYGRIYAAVRAAGRQPRRRAADLLIAATALAAGVPHIRGMPTTFRASSRSCGSSLSDPLSLRGGQKDSRLPADQAFISYAPLYPRTSETKAFSAAASITGLRTNVNAAAPARQWPRPARATRPHSRPCRRRTPRASGRGAPR